MVLPPANEWTFWATLVHRPNTGDAQGLAEDLLHRGKILFPGTDGIKSRRCGKLRHGPRRGTAR